MRTEGHIVVVGITNGMTGRKVAKSEDATKMAIGKMSPALASVG